MSLRTEYGTTLCVSFGTRTTARPFRTGFAGSHTLLAHFVRLSSFMSCLGGETGSGAWLSSSMPAPVWEGGFFRVCPPRTSVSLQRGLIEGCTRSNTSDASPNKGLPAVSFSPRET